MASAYNEKFAEVDIITLQAHLTNIEIENMLLSVEDLNAIEEDVTSIVQKKLKDKIYKNFIEIKNGKIKVVIDCKKITDNTISIAFEMLSCIEKFNNDIKIEFNRTSQIYAEHGTTTQ